MFYKGDFSGASVPSLRIFLVHGITGQSSRRWALRLDYIERENYEVRKSCIKTSCLSTFFFLARLDLSNSVLIGLDI
jgi:hypothetical protein